MNQPSRQVGRAAERLAAKIASNKDRVLARKAMRRASRIPTPIDDFSYPEARYEPFVSRGYSHRGDRTYGSQEAARRLARMQPATN